LGSENDREKCAEPICAEHDAEVHTALERGVEHGVMENLGEYNNPEEK
jgi:hypothetical protein